MQRLASRLLPLFLILSSSATVLTQDTSQLLARLQRSRAYLNIDTNVQHGKGMWGVTYGNPGDVWRYPNSLSCLVVFGDGKYVFEKRDEATVGKPKVKQAQGQLSADDLQRLKAIVEDDEFQKIKDLKMPDLPDDAQAIRELDSLDVQVNHSATSQRFTTVKERVKTGALISATSGPSAGVDTYLDNAEAHKKTLTPLIKWFDGVEKKSKSEMKEAKPQVCAPMNIG